jgi:hypothetical protein
MGHGKAEQGDALRLGDWQGVVEHNGGQMLEFT